MSDLTVYFMSDLRVYYNVGKREGKVEGMNEQGLTKWNKNSGSGEGRL